MEHLSALILKSEEWLMKRVLFYAKRQNYVKYTSTLKEAWRISIQGLSAAVTNSINTGHSIPEIGPDEDFTGDPVASFGITEAQKHRHRGINISMFLGLFKYYRDSYYDLIRESGFDTEMEDRYISYVSRVFDRIEIGFCSEWASISAEESTRELQLMNRAMTNEKNKFLTVTESLSSPVILIDNNQRIEYINSSAAKLLGMPETPGGFYYNKESMDVTLPPWLQKKIGGLYAGKETAKTVDYSHETRNGRFYFIVDIRRMMDVSEKFSGVVVIMHDVTFEKAAEQSLTALLDEKELLLKEIHHRVKNNFAIVSSLLALQLTKFSDKKIQEALRESINRIKTMSLIHQNLYQSESLSGIDLEGYVKGLAKNLFESYGDHDGTVHFTTDIEPITLSIDRTINLGLIINELVTNALKYAFPEKEKMGGIIRVACERDAEKQIKLRVEDNGIGIPEEMEVRKTATLGLQLVFLLAEKQMKGSVKLDRTGGTRWEIFIQE